MTRSSLLLVALALVLGACGAGDDPGPASRPPGPPVDAPLEPPAVPPTDPPSAPEGPPDVEPPPPPEDGSSIPGVEDVAVSITSEGGLVPLEFALAQLPSLVIYADGTVVRPGPVPEIYPGPLVPALELGRIAPQTLDWLVTAADESGLFDESIDFGFPGVTDLDSTSITVRIGGEHRSVGAYALYEEFSDDPALTTDQREARDALMALLSSALSAVETASGWTEPALDRVVVWALPYFERTDIDAGPPVDWPLNAALIELDLDTQRACVELTGRRATRVLDAAATATQLTPWQVGTERYAVVLRPALTARDACNP